MIIKRSNSRVTKVIQSGILLSLLGISAVVAADETIAAGDTFIPGSAKIFETSKSVKDKGFQDVGDVTFEEGELSDGVVINLDATVAMQRQTIDGIGGAMTESTTFLISTLPDTERDEVMKEIFSPEGSWYSMLRISIASCDFSLSTYTYTDNVDLSGFSIERDTHVTIPRLLQAKELAGGWDELRILASPWSAPPSMKHDPENNSRYPASGGFAGGELKSQYMQNFADYVVMFLEAYQDEGVEMWGMTPLNEPHGNGYSWDSMHMEGDVQAEYVGDYLYPAMVAADFGHLGLYGFDQNKGDRDDAFIDGMLEHDESLDMEDKAFAGIGLHWYFSTYNTFDSKLDKWHKQYPDYKLLATEATIDNLRADNEGEGKTGYGPLVEINGLVPGVNDIEPQADCSNDRCQQSDPTPKWNYRYPWVNAPDAWEWWFERVHGSWAFEVTESWGVDAAAESPLTEPFYHYGRDIIHSFNHWVTGWIDWNIVLNEQGGPNWAKNWCTAPITITSEGEVIYNPTFYLFRHFSKFIRPGSKIIDVQWENNESTMDNSGHNISGIEFLEVTAAINPEGKVVIVIMNDENTDTDYSINLAGKSFTGSIEANAMQTILVENDFISSSSSEISSSDNGSSDGSVSSEEPLSGSSEESSPESGSSEGSSNDSSAEPLSSGLVGIHFGDDRLKNTSMFSRLLQSNLDVSISEAGFYTVKVYDITGKQVATINPGLLYKGAQTLELGNLNLGDAMYLVRTEIVK